MTSSLCRVEGTDHSTILINDHNAPPGLLESWADYHDTRLELEFGPEPPLTEEHS